MQAARIWSGSGGFLGRSGESSIEFRGRSEDLLVRYLGFGEQNRPFMQLLLAFFGGFAARFVSLFVSLRFEPNFLFALFGSEL